MSGPRSQSFLQEALMRLIIFLNIYLIIMAKSTISYIESQES